jgi:hypothetical protein
MSNEILFEPIQLGSHGYTDYPTLGERRGPPEMGDAQALPTGQAWLEIVKRPSQEDFASAFTEDVVLDASVLSAPIVGAIAIRAFFDATRGMYDRIEFVNETRSATRIHLEWQGRFAGRDIAGSTILAHDAEGAIESVRLYHRPYEQVIAFSAELAGKVDPRCFPER